MANAVRLLVAVGTFFAKPELLTGLKSGVSVHDTLKKMMARAPPSVTTIAETLTGDARVILDGFGRDLPADADVLFEQMVMSSLPDPRTIVNAGMEPDRIVTEMLFKLTDQEHIRPPMPNLFAQIVVPTFEALVADVSFAADLNPAWMRATLGLAQDSNREIRETRVAVSVLPDAIIDRMIERGLFPPASVAMPGPDAPPGIQTVEVATLLEVAGEFGGAPSEAPADVLTFLRDKAADMERLARQVEALSGISERIDNIRGAASEAIRRGHLGEARKLLHGAREVQKELLRKPLEANAAIMEAQAEIDLIEGRVEEAAKIYAAAADSFASIDPLEPARRQLGRYSGELFHNGQRYGSNGVMLATALIRKVLTDALRKQDPELWAGGHSNLATALGNQVESAGSAEGSLLLSDAIAAYRKSLDVYTEDRHPAEWASTKNNLAVALCRQGRRIDTEAGVALLSESVEACYCALRVRTEQDYPEQWANTQVKERLKNLRLLA